MIKILSWLLLISIATAIGWLIQRDPGYILIAYQHYTLEMPLWFGIFIIILFAGIFSFIKSIFHNIIYLPIKLKQCWQQHKFVYQQHQQEWLLKKQKWLNQHDWNQLYAHSTDLKKYRLLDAKELLMVQVNYYQQQLIKISSENIAALNEQWKKIPYRLHHQAELIAAYAKKLMANQPANAELLLRQQLNRDWQNELLNLYSEVAKHNPKTSLTYIEKWLKKHNNDALLFLLAGQLCIELKLWGKARSYLEKSIALKPSVGAYANLAKLNEQMHFAQDALVAYRKSIELLDDHLGQ